MFDRSTKPSSSLAAGKNTNSEQLLSTRLLRKQELRKQELRKQMQGSLSQASDARVQGFKLQLTSFLTRYPGLWLGFRSLPSEPELPQLPKIKWAYPLFSNSTLMRYFCWSASGGDLGGAISHVDHPTFERAAVRSSVVAIEEPRISDPKWREVDLRLERPVGVLVPGLAFDRDLNRLGRGRGFFDRFIAHLESVAPQVLVIGVGYNEQRVAAVPTEGHDARLDGFLSDRECVLREMFYRKLELI